MKRYSLVPSEYKEKDPRRLPWLYPKSLNVFYYAKKMQEFMFYQSLEVAEDIANKQGFILVPYECIHWRRKKLFGSDRKIKIGSKSFFLMKLPELTKGEEMNLINHLEELKEQRTG